MIEELPSQEEIATSLTLLEEDRDAWYAYHRELREQMMEACSAYLELEEEIGVAEGAYSGPIVNVRTNVYRIITDTEEEILLGVSTGEDGTVVIRLYADGAYVDEYVMTEHFES